MDILYRKQQVISVLKGITAYVQQQMCFTGQTCCIKRSNNFSLAFLVRNITAEHSFESSSFLFIPLYYSDPFTPRNSPDTLHIPDCYSDILYIQNCYPVSAHLRMLSKYLAHLLPIYWHLVLSRTLLWYLTTRTYILIFSDFSKTFQHLRRRYLTSR